MRKVVTSLLATAASGLAGGLVAQQLAVRTSAGQEFIAVFFFDALILLVAALCFLVAQFLGPRAVSKAALGLAILLMLLLAALIVFSVSQASPAASLRADAILSGSIALSGLTILLGHWLVVRWRMG